MPRVRKAKPNDAAPLALLAERTFRAAFGPSNAQENMDAHCVNAYSEASQAREIVDPQIETFICEEKSELIAYAQLRWGSAPACVTAAKPAEIQRIYVEQRWHGSGIAKTLMFELLAAASAGGADRAWLGVWEHNPRAIAFYEKFGFMRVGHHIFLLGSDPQHDLVFSREVQYGRSVEHAPIVESILACPHCGFASVEVMPTDACVFFHECARCHVLLRPRPGDCCVFCSYGSVKCPPMQEGTSCFDGDAPVRG